MKRVPLYSRASSRHARGLLPAAPIDDDPPEPPGPWQQRLQRARSYVMAHERAAWALGAVLLAVVAGWPAWTRHEVNVPSFEQIDAAMREAIAKEPLQSAAANAYEAVIGSVVRVVGEHPAARPDPKEGEEGKSVGTGVVIVDKGLILTNLHVVQGAARLKVTFWNWLNGARLCRPWRSTVEIQPIGRGITQLLNGSCGRPCGVWPGS